VVDSRVTHRCAEARRGGEGDLREAVVEDGVAQRLLAPEGDEPSLALQAGPVGEQQVGEQPTAHRKAGPGAESGAAVVAEAKKEGLLVEERCGAHAGL
jgi:hypothetical protein